MEEHHERQEIQTFQARHGWGSVADGPAHGRPRAGRSTDTPHLPRRSLTNLDYGLSLVAFSHTVGCAGHLAARISRHSGALVSACCALQRGCRQPQRWATQFRTTLSGLCWSRCFLVLSSCFSPGSEAGSSSRSAGRTCGNLSPTTLTGPPRMIVDGVQGRWDHIQLFAKQRTKREAPPAGAGGACAKG